MTDTPADSPDPTAELRAQLAAANDRLIQSELRSQAVRAGIIDLDLLKLLDTSALKLTDDGTLPDVSATLATLKRDKPWAFAQPNSSHPAQPPAAEPPKTRMAKDMTFREWQLARSRLINGR